MTKPGPAQVTPAQQALRDQIQQIMNGLTALWDDPNPAPHSRAMLQFLLLGVSLGSPAHAGTLDLFTKLAAALSDPNKAVTLTVLLDEMEADSTEAQYVRYILDDGKNMPSWPDVAAKLIELVTIQASASAAPTQVIPTVPAQPAAPVPVAPPAPTGPAAVLAALTGTITAPVPAAPAPAPTAAPTRGSGKSRKSR